MTIGRAESDEQLINHLMNTSLKMRRIQKEVIRTDRQTISKLIW